MSLLITKGRKAESIKAVVYGPEGTGKSSLASLLPSPVFIDVEGSTGRLDVARVEPRNVADILGAITEIRTRHAADYRTVVIDTADWIEAIYAEEMCKSQRKASIAECGGGYGKGYVELGRKFLDFLDALDAVAAAGLHVVILAHCKTVKVSPPDQVEGFTRFQLKLNEEHVAAKMKEWAHLVLFVRRDVQLIKGKDDRIKGGTTAAEHVIQTSYAPAWDAKNRHDLPEQLPYLKSQLPPELRAIFYGQRASSARPAATAQATPAPAPVQPAAITPEPPALEPTVPMADASQVEKLITYAKNSVALPIIEKALAFYKAIELAELTYDQATKVVRRCQDEMDKAAAGGAA
jgi:hypothetical protein